MPATLAKWALRSAGPSRNAGKTSTEFLRDASLRFDPVERPQTSGSLLHLIIQYGKYIAVTTQDVFTVENRQLEFYGTTP